MIARNGRGIVFFLLVSAVCVGCRALPPSDGTPTGADTRASVPGPAPAESTVRVTQMEPVDEKVNYALIPDFFTVPLPSGGTGTVPMVLQRTTYAVAATVGAEGEGAKEWTGKLWCYELNSASADMPYTFSFWEPWVDEKTISGSDHLWPPRAVQLFSIPPDEKYLGGAGESVWIMDVSHPNNRDTELQRYFAARPSSPGYVNVGEVAARGGTLAMGSAQVRPVPWYKLFGIWNFAHETGPVEIHLRDVSRREGAKLVVTVSGLDPNKVFAAIFDGKEWQAGKEEPPRSSSR